jgi:murein endopeptidase
VRTAKRFLAIAALLGSALALAAIVRAAGESRPARTAPTVTPEPQRPARPPKPGAARPRTPAIDWRASTPLGTHTAGRLARGVRLPAEGAHFTTWDPVRKRTPNRWWRRYATDDVVRVLLRVTRRFAAAHPDAPRILVGDLSRPRGGDFGRRFGPLGHVSHQNGLDADVYLPRKDRRERAARRIGQVDRKLAQDLVDRFVREGARRIFVGAGLRLRGPASVVQPWPNHDDHLHVRF